MIDNQYNFPNSILEGLKNLAIYEAKKLLITGVFSKKDIINSIKGIDDDVVTAHLKKDRIVQLRFQKLSYYDEVGMLQETTDFDLEVCEIKVSRDYNVIKTKVINESGTIQERYYGGDDYQITIDGLLIGSFGVINSLEPLNLRPTREIKELLKIANANVPIVCISPYLNEVFGISALQIESIDVPFETEYKNIQRFSIKAVSNNQNLKYYI